MSALPCLKGKLSCSIPTTCRCEAAEWLMARDAINHSDYCGGTQIVHQVQGVRVMQSHHTHTHTVVYHAPLLLWIQRYQHYITIKILTRLVKHVFFYLQLCVLYNVTYRFGYSLHANCDNTFPKLRSKCT